MPNENTQKPPPLPLGTRCELLWTHAKIMRRHLGCSEPTKRLSVFGPAKQQLIRLASCQRNVILGCCQRDVEKWQLGGCFKITLLRGLYESLLTDWVGWSDGGTRLCYKLFLSCLRSCSAFYGTAGKNLQITLNNKMGCVYFFSWVEQERLTVMRANESQTPSCVLGGKFQDFGYLTKILSLDSFPTWCQNGRRVNVWTVYRRSLNAQ